MKTNIRLWMYTSNGTVWYPFCLVWTRITCFRLENINISFLFDWVYLSNYLCKPFCQGRIAFFCPHSCNFVVSCTAKKNGMQCNDIIIIVSSYHWRRECHSSSKWRMTAEWSFDVLENVAPSPLIFILSRQPGAKFCGWTLFWVKKVVILYTFMYYILKFWKIGMLHCKYLVCESFESRLVRASFTECDRGRKRLTIANSW